MFWAMDDCGNLVAFDLKGLRTDFLSEEEGFSPVSQRDVVYLRNYAQAKRNPQSVVSPIGKVVRPAFSKEESELRGYV